MVLRSEARFHSSPMIDGTTPPRTRLRLERSCMSHAVFNIAAHRAPTCTGVPIVTLNPRQVSALYTFPYTLRTHYAESTFRAQISRVQQLTSKNTKNEKLHPYTFLLIWPRLRTSSALRFKVVFPVGPHPNRACQFLN